MRRLDSDGVRDNELLIEICRSREQGIQRLGFDLLPDLIMMPPDEGVVRDLAQIASSTDDVGVPRRLVVALGKTDCTLIDIAMNATGNLEEGVRRRAFEAVEGTGKTCLGRGVRKECVFSWLYAKADLPIAPDGSTGSGTEEEASSRRRRAPLPR